MLQQLAPVRAGSDRAPPAGAAVSGAYKVDISRGERIGRVSSEWFSRPDDERYLSLGDLYAAVRNRADRATARTVETEALGVEGSRDDGERLALIVPGRDEPIAPTHWSFGQMCMSGNELMNFLGIMPEPAQPIGNLDPALREQAVKNCMDVLRECNEPRDREIALDLLGHLGVLQ